ncbi:hypothetical protein E2562_002608 [Oryza meyeriana var. granulata]|uniref:Uncharacterized protein n=1 Tax=Oryza meyeriana var. granulata TaxID=110450 RepID=A0A6G1F2Y7_9ORYZ|nr:hypothetical protein E2562_002608 [Oryza meyeriana var. granulata]
MTQHAALWERTIPGPPVSHPVRERSRHQRHPTPNAPPPENKSEEPDKWAPVLWLHMSSGYKYPSRLTSEANYCRAVYPCDPYPPLVWLVGLSRGGPPRSGRLLHRAASPAEHRTASRLAGAERAEGDEGATRWWWWWYLRRSHWRLGAAWWRGGNAGGGVGVMGSGAKRHFFPLTSLQIGIVCFGC